MYEIKFSEICIRISKPLEKATVHEIKKQRMVTGKYRYSDTVVSQAQDLQLKRQHGIAVQSATKQITSQYQ